MVSLLIHQLSKFNKNLLALVFNFYRIINMGCIKLQFYGQNICVHTRAFYRNSLNLNPSILIFYINLMSHLLKLYHSSDISLLNFNHTCIPSDKAQPYKSYKIHFNMIQITTTPILLNLLLYF